MPRVRSQLAIQADPELLERLRAAAAAQRRTVTSLAVEWLEAGLAGHLAPAAAAADLSARVAALEAAMARLQQVQAATPRASERVNQPSPKRVIPAPQAGEHPSPDGAITTTELAAQTGTNRAAWNNWASAERIGQVRSHPQAGAWRLVGQAPPPGGGPLRWLWRPA